MGREVRRDKVYTASRATPVVCSIYLEQQVARREEEAARREEDAYGPGCRVSRRTWGESTTWLCRRGPKGAEKEKHGTGEAGREGWGDEAGDRGGACRAGGSLDKGDFRHKVQLVMSTDLELSKRALVGLSKFRTKPVILMALGDNLAAGLARGGFACGGLRCVGMSSRWDGRKRVASWWVLRTALGVAQGGAGPWFRDLRPGGGGLAKSSVQFVTCCSPVDIRPLSAWLDSTILCHDSIAFLGDGAIPAGGSAKVSAVHAPLRTSSRRQLGGPGVGLGNAQRTPAEPSNAHHSIPIAKLSRPDPILFYTETPLFNGELHDNGALHRIYSSARCGDDADNGSGDNSSGNRRLQPRPIQPTMTELQRRGDNRPQQQPQRWQGCETTVTTKTSTTMAIPTATTTPTATVTDNNRNSNNIRDDDDDCNRSSTMTKESDTVVLLYGQDIPSNIFPDLKLRAIRLCTP
ncbi:hypothetical protein EDB85DRAFT_1887903 [Lactarius pseudohatsudake]|nr:hypothetical protein EDB85DRAFT_1887903 [Lactarius pseudohatsudake]